MGEQHLLEGLPGSTELKLEGNTKAAEQEMGSEFGQRGSRGPVGTPRDKIDGQVARIDTLLRSKILCH